MTVALRRPIFKQIKGSATISLGLNYCSMGSSQSPSHDTVPLSFILIFEFKKSHFSIDLYRHWEFLGNRPLILYW
jgi:hypothetical protein